MADLDQRIAWADQIKEIDDDYKRKHFALVEAEQRAKSALDSLEEEFSARLKNAAKALQAAQRARWEATEAYQQRTGPLLRNLRSTASSGRISQFRKELEDLRKAMEPQIEYSSNSSFKRPVRSTAASVRRAVDVVNRIIVDSLPIVEIEPLSDEELELRLSDLKTSIPKITMESI